MATFQPANGQSAVEEALRFYPLELGAVWQYSGGLQGMPPTLSTYEVIGDSALSNGQTYRVIRHDWRSQAGRGSGIVFERVDSVQALVWRYSPSEQTESVRFALAPVWGDSTRGSHVCQVDREWNGRRAQICRLSGNPRVDDDWYLSEEVGLYRHWFADAGVVVQDLVYFRSSQLGWGTPVSVETAEIPRDLAVSLFPNPTTGHVTVNVRLPGAETWSVRVLDLLGRLVWSGSPTSGLPADDHLTLELDLPSGVYLVRAVSSSGAHTRPLVIRR
ncbi:MAG: T9SS type A sorting domain-containing protein [Rhodothermales bacterium]|nr:T9SS type A sorting domain-containing protein [Rhodothermales bacterium]MBO6780145.1 T9SS type A sorting domain-containing protein [Rhodothermales bacterium]